jgi:hypothetical protein
VLNVQDSNKDQDERYSAFGVPCTIVGFIVQQSPACDFPSKR